MATCGVSGRRVILSFNFNCSFSKDIALLYNQRKDIVIFSPKELQKEQADVVESPRIKSFSFK